MPRGLDADLVAEITLIDSETGETCSAGTGYPISADRIVTAAHVLFDEDTHQFLCNSPKVTVSFHGEQFPDSIKTDVESVWNGFEVASVDAAVLRCVFPRNVLPDHEFPSGPLKEAGIRWHSRGFSSGGDEHELLDSVEGSMPTSSSGDPTVNLSSDQSKVDWKKWKGVSGAPVFRADRDSDLGKPLFIGLITDYSDIDRDDHFTMVPMWKLLGLDGFADAIGPERLRSAEHHAKLAELRKRIHDRLVQLAPMGPVAELYRKEMKHECSAAVESLMGTPLDQVSENLYALQRKIAKLEDDSRVTALRIIAEVQDCLFPLRFCETTVAAIRSRLRPGSGVLVKGAVFRASVAEILLAAAEGRQARFQLSGEETDPQGVLSLRLPSPLAVGPSDVESGIALQLVRDLCKMEIDGVPLLDGRKITAREEECKASCSAKSDGSQDFECQLRIFGTALHDQIARESRANDGSTIYCVVDLLEFGAVGLAGDSPNTDSAMPIPRDTALKVINKVNEYVPSLLFLEQVMDTDIELRDEPYFRCLTLRGKLESRK